MNTIQYIRKEQKVNSFAKSIEINGNRKSGNLRGKPRLASDITMMQLKNLMTETQTMNMSKFTIRAHITYIIEEIITLLQYSIDKKEGLQIYWANLITLNNIEDIKRELRKALEWTDASDIIFDKTTPFKVQ